MRKKVKRMKAAMCELILEQSNCAVRICVLAALLLCGSSQEIKCTGKTLPERREEKEELKFVGETRTTALE